MAISKEDKQDVKTHLGKALANKVADATRDHSGKLRKVAKKNLYDMGVKNKGKEETIKGMKSAFGGRETRNKMFKEVTAKRKATSPSYQEAGRMSGMHDRVESDREKNYKRIHEGLARKRELKDARMREAS